MGDEIDGAGFYEPTSLQTSYPSHRSGVLDDNVGASEQGTSNFLIRTLSKIEEGAAAFAIQHSICGYLQSIHPA